VCVLNKEVGSVKCTCLDFQLSSEEETRRSLDFSESAHGDYSFTFVNIRS